MTNRAKGLTFVIPATLMFAYVGIFAKQIPVSSFVLLCAWVIVGFPVYFISALTRRKLAVKKRDLGYIVLVSLVLLIADVAFLTSVKLMLVSVATFLKFLFPVLIVTFAAPLIWKKKVTKHYLGTAMLGLVGLFVVVRPWNGAEMSAMGAVLALVSAVGLAFGFTLFKRIDHVPRETYLAYRYLLGSVLLIPFVGLTEPVLEILTPPIVFPLIIFGIVYGVVASLFDSKSFVYLDEREIGIIKYFEPVAATVFAALLLSESISIAVVVGGLIILASGLMVAVRRKPAEDVPILGAVD